MSGLLGSDSDQKDADVLGPAPEAAGDEIKGAADASGEPAKPRQRRKRAASRSGSGAAILAGSDADEALGAPDPTESLIVTPGEVRKEHSRARTEPSAGEPRPSDLHPEQARHGPSGPGREAYAAAAGYGDTWPYYDLSVYDHRRDRARKLAIAAAVLGMGGLLFAAWLNEEPQTPRSDTNQPIVASAKPAAVAAVGPQDMMQPYAGTDTADANAGLTPEERAVMASDTMAASSSLGQWFGSVGATPGEVATPQASGSADSSQAQSAAEPGPAEALAVATRQALALAQSREAAVPAPAAPSAATAPAKAPALQARTGDAAVASAAGPSGAATASPAPTVTRTDVRTVAASPASRPISTPAKWIGGGPTDADNRRGRYRGSVVVQFTVQSEGRASDCTVVRPSGNAQMDALTCRIVTERARFTPARDAQGRYVASQAHATYNWGRGRRQQK